MPASPKKEQKADLAQRHKESLEWHKRRGLPPPGGRVKVVSQTRSHGDEIVKACLYGFAGGESIKVPVRGGGFLVAEVPQLDSEVWLEDNCVEFVVPPEEKQEPEEKNEQGQEEVQTIEEVHKNAEELYKKRLAAAGGQTLATSADEELDSKNFAKVKEQKGDIYDQERRKYDRSKKLKEGNKEYEKRRGPDGQIPTTQVDDMEASNFAKPSPMKPKKYTQTETRNRRYRWGRRDTKKALKDAKKEHDARPRGDDGSVKPTYIDDTPQRARFGDATAYHNRKKFMTQKEETNKGFGYGRTATKADLQKAKVLHDARRGDDGKVQATAFDDTPLKARFAQAKEPRRKVLTQKEKKQRDCGYGRKGTRVENQKAKREFSKRPRNEDGKLTTEFDETPLKARFAQPTKSTKNRGKAEDPYMPYGRGDSRKIAMENRLKYEARLKAEPPKLRDLSPKFQRPAENFKQTLEDVREDEEEGDAQEAEGKQLKELTGEAGELAVEQSPGHATTAGGAPITLENDESRASSPRMPIQPMSGASSPQGLKI